MFKQIPAVLASVIAVGMGLPGTAEAITLNFDQTSTSTNDPATGASAQVDFDFVDISGGVELNLTLLNTTGQTTFGQGATDSKFVAFGFDIPDADLGYSYDSLFSAFNQVDDATIGGLGGQNVFDIGIRAGSGKFQGGNPNSGLSAGESASVKFTFETADSAAAFEAAFAQLFSDGDFHAVARFQAVEGPGFSGASDKLFISDTSQDNPEAVPEPVSSLAVLALGAVFAAGTLKQQNA